MDEISDKCTSGITCAAELPECAKQVLVARGIPQGSIDCLLGSLTDPEPIDPGQCLPGTGGSGAGGSTGGAGGAGGSTGGSGGSGAGGSTGGTGGAGGGCVAEDPLLLVTGSYAKSASLDAGCFGGSVADAGVHVALVDSNCGTCRGFLTWGTQAPDPLTAAPAVRHWAEAPHVLGRYRGAPELLPACDDSNVSLAQADNDSVFVAKIGQQGGGQPCVDWVTSLVSQTAGRTPRANDLAAASGFVYVVGGLDGAALQVVAAQGDQPIDPEAAGLVLKLTAAGEHERAWTFGPPTTASGGGSGGNGGGGGALGGGNATGWGELAARDSANGVAATSFGLVVAGGIRFHNGITDQCGDWRPSPGTSVDLVGSVQQDSQKIVVWQGSGETCSGLRYLGADHGSGERDQQLGYALAYADSLPGCALALAGTAGQTDWDFGGASALPEVMEGQGKPSRGDGFVARFAADPCPADLGLEGGAGFEWAIRWRALREQPVAAVDAAVHRVAFAGDGAIVASAYLNDVASKVVVHWDRSNGTQRVDDAIPPPSGGGRAPRSRRAANRGRARRWSRSCSAWRTARRRARLVGSSSASSLGGPRAAAHPAGRERSGGARCCRPRAWWARWVRPSRAARRRAWHSSLVW